MAIKTAQATVTTTAAAVAVGAGDDTSMGWAATVCNRGTVSVFLGGPDVSIANGYEVLPGGVFAGSFSAADDLWAVAASGSQRVDVLRAGVA